ncbi:MAG: cation transporter [Anaerolineae bacterium]|nr:cation transporter [Anaerolineae bacterium]
MGHSHNHAGHGGIERRFLLSLALTGLIFAAELVGGLLTRSLALLSDAAHVFLDVFALALSYVAIRLTTLPPNDRHTYGYHRLRVLAALVNGATLLVVAFEIFREAIKRFSDPEPILAGPMLVVAVIGLVVNLVVAFVLRGHDHEDLNVRSAFLHVLGDALASVGVIIAGVVIILTGWTLVDPVISIVIGVIILLGSGNVLRRSVHILVEGVPRGLTATEVAESMNGVSGVSEVHDLHVWTVSPEYIALSAHVVLDDQSLSEAQGILEDLETTLSEQFGIDHTTIQVECQSCVEGTIVCPYEVNDHG